MSKKVTLGGDRLGTGRKMTVQMRNFGRSSHDQGFVFTTDQAFGTLVPALCQIGTRGDTFYLDNIESLVRTLPTNGPVFGSVKQQIDVFVAPIRLYIGALHNNMTGVGLKMDQIKMPVTQHVTTTYPKDVELRAANRKSVAKDSLEAYLGLNASPMGTRENPNQVYTKNALFKLMYWDIYKNYYANKQEEEGVIILGKNQAITIKSFTGFLGSNPDRTITIDAGGWSQSGNPCGPNGSSWEIEISQDGITAEVMGDVLEIYVNVNGNARFYSINELSNILDRYTIGALQFTKFSNQPKYNLVFTKVENASVTFSAGLPGARLLQDSREAIEMTRFPLKNIDAQRERILAAPIGTPFIENTPKAGLPYTATTELFTDDGGDTRETMAQSMCGLGIKTHLSDIFNNWLQTDWLDGENGINEITAVEVKDGHFTMDELNFKQKLFNMMNRIAVQDGSYDAWQTAVYGATGPMIAESPIYVGGYSSEISFDEVVSTAASNEEPLGSLAGRGSTQQQTKKGGKNIKIKCTEASLIMVINSFTPRVSYSQGNEWYLNLQSMDDLHKPDMDGIAFQVLPSGWMNGACEKFNETNARIESEAVGKQPSWTQYTTAVNKTFGDFASGGALEHMVINRTYEVDHTGTIENATTYIDPTEFNVIFADQRLTAKPFWVQIGFDLTSRRVMSANQMPIM